jgi:hypothetical protein
MLGKKSKEDAFDACHVIGLKRLWLKSDKSDKSDEKAGRNVGESRWRCVASYLETCMVCYKHLILPSRSTRCCLTPWFTQTLVYDQPRTQNLDQQAGDAVECQLKHHPDSKYPHSGILILTVVCPVSLTRSRPNASIMQLTARPARLVSLSAPISPSSNLFHAIDPSERGVTHSDCAYPGQWSCMPRSRRPVYYHQHTDPPRRIHNELDVRNGMLSPTSHRKLSGRHSLDR